MKRFLSKGVFCIVVLLIVSTYSIACNKPIEENEKFHSYDEESKLAAGYFASGAMDGGGGGQSCISYSTGREGSFEDLAQTIFDAKSSYNEPFMVDNAHIKEANIEGCYLHLKDAIETNPDYVITNENFTKQFKRYTAN
jgi:hypothetical protein